MYLTIHGHFYQPPRENPWTGTIPRHDGSAPFHDWNARISAECYAPNGRSRVLDDKGRIEEIVNNYEWIHFDFGPTLLRWMESEFPEVYASLIDADRRSRERFGGHGNAIAQAYNHMILPLATYREKRTQILWGLRDFEHRFGRKSESLWLPEAAVDEETLRVLAEFGIRYIVLAPTQARRVRPLTGGAWTDVSGGRIDPRQPYRIRVRTQRGQHAGVDVFFYDGPISAAISFDHLLRTAEGFADRLQAAGRGAPPEALVHAATDGEVYGHHEPFGDMCLAYLIAREGPLRGFRFTNYGAFLDEHPPTHEVDLEPGDGGEGTSWSCMHGIARWKANCGCSTGGKTGWNQKWRKPLRKGLEHLRDRLLEVYVTNASELIHDPFEGRDDYIEILLRGEAAREEFLSRHARRSLTSTERTRLWRMIEAQHQSMLMFTSCAWFFSDVSGIEVQQNLAYAARAIELVQPFASLDLEEVLLGYLADARSNIPSMGTAADVWMQHVRPQKKAPSTFAVEAAALLAAQGDLSHVRYPAVAVSLDGEMAGSLSTGGIEASINVVDRTIDETYAFRVRARRDDHDLLRLEAIAAAAEGPGSTTTASVSDLPEELQGAIVRELLADLLAQEAERFDAIFESSRPLLERHRGQRTEILPPIFRALAEDVSNRRIRRAAERLEHHPPDTLDGTLLQECLGHTMQEAWRAGVEPDCAPVASVIERALVIQLGDTVSVSKLGVDRSLSLLRAADRNGIKIRRTRLEEMVYALLNHHRDTLGARLSGRPVSVQEPGVGPESLIQLAEQSNLSLRSFERAPARRAV